MRLPALLLSASLVANLGLLGWFASRSAANSRVRTTAPTSSAALPHPPAPAGLTLEQVSRMPDRIKRETAFLGLAAGADAATLPVLLAEVRRQPPSPTRTRWLSELYRRWGALDPAGAMDAAAPLPPLEKGTRTDEILQGWVLADPRAAADWVASHPTVNPANSGSGFVTLVSTLLDAERFGDAISIFERLTNRNEQLGLSYRLAGYFAEFNLRAGEAWLRESPVSYPRTGAVTGLAKAMAEREAPDYAIAFAQAQPTDPNGGRAAALATVFGVLANRWTPPEAAAWFSRQTAGPDLNQAMQAFLPGFLERYPDEALRLINYAVDPATWKALADQARTRFASNQPAMAFNLINATAPPGPDRLEALRYVTRIWSYADPDAASRLVMSANALTDTERQALLATVEEARPRGP